MSDAEQLVFPSQAAGPAYPSQAQNVSGQWGPKKVNYSHEAMAELIITNPWINQCEIAKHFGYTEAWVCMVIASDAFQAFLATRKDQLINPEIRATIEERFRALVVKASQVLMSKLDANPSGDLAIQTLNGAAKALGYGAKAPQQQMTVQFVVEVPPKAASSAEWAGRHGAAPIETPHVPVREKVLIEAPKPAAVGEPQSTDST